MSWGHQIPRSPAGRDHPQQQRSYRPPASPGARTPATLPLRPPAITQRSRSSSSGSYDDHRGGESRYGAQPQHHRGGITAALSPNRERRIITRKVEHFRDSPPNSYEDDNRGRRRGRRSVDEHFNNSDRLMIPRSGTANVRGRRGSIDSYTSGPVGEGVNHTNRGRICRGQIPVRAQSYDTGDAYGSSSRFSPSPRMADRHRLSGPPIVVSDTINHSNRLRNNRGRRASSPVLSSSTRIRSSSSASPGYVVGSDAAYIDYVLTPDNIDMSQFTIHSFERKNKKSDGSNAGSGTGESIEEEEDITSFLSKRADDGYEITYYHSVQYRNEVVWILETKCKVFDNDTYYQGDTSSCSLSKNSNDGVVCIKICHKNGVEESDNPMEALSSSYSSFSSSPRTSVSPSSRGRGTGSSRSRSMSPGPLYSGTASSRSRSTSRSNNTDANSPGCKNGRRSPSVSSSRRYTEDLRDILRRSAQEYENEMTKPG